MNQTWTVLRERLHGIWRFRWHAVGIAWLLTIVGAVVVLCLPEVHEARARVLVDAETTLRPLLEGISAGDSVEARLALVQQAMLGQAQLEKVVRRTKYGSQIRDPKEFGREVARLKKNIVIGPDKPLPGKNEAPRNVYVITYKGPSYEQSLDVVRTVLNVFVEDSVRGSREGSEIAQDFLRNQLRESEQRLGESERRLADFKRDNVGVIPGERGDYFGRLQSEIDAMRKVQADLSVAQSRVDEIERQMRGQGPGLAAAGGGAEPAAGGAARASSAGAAGSTSRPGTSSGAGAQSAALGAPVATVGGGPVPLGGTAQSIDEAEARLNELLLRYTDKHPDVIALRETIASLKKRQQEEISAFRRGDVTAVTASGLSKNPIYQRMQLALNDAQVEVAALRRDLGVRSARVNELQALLNKAPEAEADYRRLTRDYEVSRTQYQAMLERLEKARVSGDASDKGFVRFEVMDPPWADVKPTPPTRDQLLWALLGAAALLGLVTAYLLHQVRPVVNSAATLQELTNLPVLGSITLALSDAQIAQRRAERFSLAVSWAALAGVVALLWLFEEPVSSLFRSFTGEL